MRTIKFRAYDLEDNKMKTVNNIDFANKLITVCDKESLEYVLNFEDVELMQSTGLRDVFNVEMFEGDVVKVYNELSDETFNMIIEFDENFASFILKHLNEDRSRIYHLSYHGRIFYQVIGNIYENKELLEQENK